MKKSRDLLEDYEDSGEYLFHGSSTANIRRFEPRQAMNNGTPDGEPAVFASSKLEPAVFMAVIGSRKTGGWNTDIGYYDEFGFYAPKADLDAAREEKWLGWVYVLGRQGFVNSTGDWEWKSSEPVSPIVAVQVEFDDLKSPVAIQAFND